MARRGTTRRYELYNIIVKHPLPVYRRRSLNHSSYRSRYTVVRMLMRMRYIIAILFVFARLARARLWDSPAGTDRDFHNNNAPDFTVTRRFIRVI